MDTIKITSGKYRGQNLKSPKSKLTHPMGAREKLALFNMIADYLPGALVLDVFAGSGALGIEALSRGASGVVFVEKDAKASRIIKQNLDNLGVMAQMFVGDIVKFTTEKMFDIILADPPYDDFKVSPLDKLSSFLKSEGILVLSHPGEPPLINGLELQKTRQYARAHISLYKK